MVSLLEVIKISWCNYGRVKKLSLDSFSYTAEVVLEISGKIITSDSEIAIT